MWTGCSHGVRKSQIAATIAKIIILDRIQFRLKLNTINRAVINAREKVSPKPPSFLWLWRFTLKHLGSQALLLSFFAFLVLFSTTGIAQSSVVPTSTRSIGTLFQPGMLLPLQLPGLSTDPLWDRDGWGNSWDKKKPKKPVGVPEGGSAPVYLTLTGFACLLAIGFGQRRKSRQPLLARTPPISS
jgi:hypothetical protein